MSMIPRAEPDADLSTAPTPSKTAILDRFVTNTGNRGAKPHKLQFL
jgi:hypothetical protein